VSATVDRLAGSNSEPFHWSRLIAIGAIVNDLRPCVVAQYAGVSELAARAALAFGAERGLLDGDVVVDLPAVTQMIEVMSIEDRHSLSSAIGRALLTASTEDVSDVHRHCQSAAGWLDPSNFVAMADHAGKLSLSTQRYESALTHLKLAVDLTTPADSDYAHRLVLLAHALDGVGRLEESQDLLERAVSLALVAGDAALAAKAAVRFALPADWLHGNTRAMELLRIASEMQQSTEDAAMITAAQGMIQMRIPVVHEERSQYAWITRATSAQAMTKAALETTDHSWVEARIVALIAWRSTHRAPQHLAKRRIVTSELLELVHHHNDARSLLMAAEWAAVDAIEAGDRETYDRNLAVASWAANRDGNPRLRWRSMSLSTGSALLDGDDARAALHLASATEALGLTDSADWEGTSVFFLAQEVISRDDPTEMKGYLSFDSMAMELSPLGQVGFSYVCARAGDHARAYDYLERSWRSLDEEASFLIHASGLAATSMRLGDFERINTLIDMLTPYSDHIAVDSHGWWVNGPVSSWLALLHSVAGRRTTALEYLEIAVPTARAINDVRTLRRLEKLSDYLRKSPTRSPSTNTVDAEVPYLGERERQVLRYMAQGLTNGEIAEEMAYSLSTIRNATVEIYRQLNAKGRADAVALAHQLGLLNHHN
jgi:DNA-binding CsgD family transcriptional regulator